jgi:putative membrane protein
VRSELGLFRRFPRLILAALAIAVVPAIYAMIYLSSVWEPNTKTNALPVAIVNLDIGISYKGQVVNLGRELAEGLVKSETFGFRAVADATAARHSVALGQLAFAVVIPKDFSANAVPGDRQGAGRLVVILSEGNNYASASFARRFAEDLGHRANEALNEKRWEQVLANADGSGKNLEKLRQGLDQVLNGAMALDEGASRNNLAATQLATGVKQAAAGLRGLNDKLPPEAELKSFKAGTQRLAVVQKELGSGLEQLHAGAVKLSDGAALLNDQAGQVPNLGEPVVKAVADLASGSLQLRQGLQAAVDTNTRLNRGAGRVETNGGKLVDGALGLSETLRATVAKLPDDARLDSFAGGSKALVDGARRVRTGIELVSAVLPATAGPLDGNAKGLADSVEPELEVLAPVANNGSAFAPNMVAMALWLGAVMTTYLFNMQLLLATHAGASSLARTVGKLALPAGLVMAQVVCTFLMLVYGLGIRAPSFTTFALTMVGAGMVFLAIVMLLLRAFGEAGKLIAVLLLTLQLAAGGGVMPIELTGDFFQAVHSWLPFTWVVKAFRASLFGAFDNGWLQAWSMMCVAGLAAFVATVFAGSWRLVENEDYKPAVEP